MKNWNELREIIQKEALIKGREFTLSSGQKTDYYYDLRKIFANPQYLDDLASHICEMWIPGNIESIGSMETGSIPLVTAISLNRQIPFFYVRKEPKKHGLQKRVEGIVKKPYIIIDDVYNTGKSINQVMNALGDPNAPFLVVINRSDRNIPAVFSKEDLK